MSRHSPAELRSGPDTSRPSRSGERSVHAGRTGRGRHRRRHSSRHPYRRRRRRPAPARCWPRSRWTRTRAATPRWSPWPGSTRDCGAGRSRATGGYGAGLARHLAEREELVVELDRPARPARRAGAKSDPIDAERAARDALCRAKLAQPRTGPTGPRCRSCSPPAGPRSTPPPPRSVSCGALVITAPEPVRARFRGQSTRIMRTTAARLRPSTAAGDVHTFTALSVLRAIAKRIGALQAEAADHERAIRGSCARGARTCLRSPGSARSSRRQCSLPGPMPGVAAMTLRSPCSPAPHPFRPPPGRPCATGSTAPVTVNSTVPCTPSRCPGYATTPPPSAYADHRRAEGKTDREIKRCLKRYISRQLYRQLEITHHAAP